MVMGSSASYSVLRVKKTSKIHACISLVHYAGMIDLLCCFVKAFPQKVQSLHCKI